MLRRLFIFSLILSGCAALQREPQGIHLKELEGSLAEIRSSAAAALPMGTRGVSGNGREIFSKHFLVSGNGDVRPAGDALERYYAVITILGDRRPYDVKVVVAHEKRVLRGDNFVYIVDYYDTMLARDIGRKLEVELAKRREDRNIIDDFRVF